MEEKLTKEMALNRIEEIKRGAAENECDEDLHIAEDRLMIAFITCCAQGVYEKDEYIEIAKIILLSGDVDFNRWCG